MEKRIEASLERQKELISERLLQSLDKESQAELADNGWMKREVPTASLPTSSPILIPLCSRFHVRS